MYILEIGPGTGTFTIEAAEHASGKGRLFVVDVQPTLVSKLNSKLKREGIAGVMTKVASAGYLPFLSNTFDRVFMGCRVWGNT